MKTRYKFIHFNPVAGGYGKDWVCRNNKTDDLLGYIEFYERWKQFVISFIDNTIFNNQCLRDIAEFLDQLNSEYKTTKDTKGTEASKGT